jgi:putative salt-induced outer membrane protein YdiY
MSFQSTLRWMGAALLFGFLPLAKGQIVNIEKQRIASDSTGWFGSANVSFSGSKTTKSILALSTGTFLECKSKSNKDLWLFITDLSFISADKEKFSNTGFGHIRYNRKLGKAIRWEFFTQIQYNSLTKIDTRILGGSGLRFKLTPYETAKFYLGIAYMYEYEQLLDPIVYHRDHRMSSYFTFTLTPEEQVTFMSTLYVQPLLTDPNDYRLSNETTLNVGITKKLSLKSSFKYAYDAFPPEGVPKSTYYFSNGLEVDF